MLRKFLMIFPVVALSTIGYGCAAGGAAQVGGGGAQSYGTVSGSGGGSANCANCGTVTEITIVESKPAGVGVGTVIGAVIGGFAGSEIGSGSGRDAATAAGAVAGGYAGTQAEAKAGQFYRITVRKDNGVFEEIYQRNPPGYGVGARVQLR